jgi:hypothetical protein
MVGSVCGTLITGALDTSPTVRLVGAVLGAAVPTLISYAGPHAHVRAGVGIAVTALALFVTYGGFTLFDFATDRPKTFPLPPAVPEPDEDAGSIAMNEGGLGIEVTPDLLRCSSAGCEEPVVIESTGERVLMIFEIEFEDDPAAEFRHDDACENTSLRKDEECRFQVTFNPLRTGGTRKVDLVIHQNFREDPTTVPVEGEVEDGDAGSPVGDLVAPPGEVRCFHQQAGTAEGEDALQISLTLRLDGASSDELPGSVLLSAQSDRGPSASGSGGVGEGRVLALPLEPEHYGQIHVVTVRVDPDSEVPETDEDNNRLTVSVDLPAEPASSQELSCAAQQG